MNKILYYIFSFIWYLFSLLPLWLLYGVSSILYYPLFYLVRYRRKVVRQNLLNSFPEKDISEIKRIEKAFYSFFCDYVVETLKLYSITGKTMSKRMTFGGLDKLQAAMGTDKSCVLYLGHYCNWEWISSLPIHMDNRIKCGQIYHPLRNKVSDKLFLKIRSRFSAINIPMKTTLRHILTFQKANQQFIVGFISDQGPKWSSIHHWLTFLNQDTPVFTGVEQIARKTKAIAFYGDVKRIKRGHYHCDFIPMSMNVDELEQNELTDMYFRYLEKTIQRDPQYWLWTHKRWKRKREDLTK
ncbi:acetyltransferase [Bacteroides sp. 519]|nr:lysophospholipid acyltransferase family protein [Bacteroides sp. 519]NDV58027.1 acetyltransferase [Bacteroides sp. 519]